MGGRLFRSLVHRVLDQARVGTLDLVDTAGGTRRFGPGGAPQAVLEVRDPGFYRHLCLYGEVGLGEAWMWGLWESPDLLATLRWMVANIATLSLHDRSGSGARTSAPVSRLFGALSVVHDLRHRLHPNSRRQAKRNIAAHYDLSNEFFALWLDPTMTYSLGLFLSEQDSLLQAQLNKYKAICTKLGLRPEHEVLDIGCGWGGFACYAAWHHGCRVRAITLSAQQLAVAQARVRALGLEDRVRVELCDYRELDGRYDRIASIGMMPHVGHRYFPAYVRCLDEHLAPDGLVLLDGVIAYESDFEPSRRHPSWTARYIFPGGMMPSIGYVAGQLVRHSRLELAEVEGFGQDYGRTMALWRDSFLASLPAVRALGFDETFVRMWRYWLAGGVANLLGRSAHACQMTLARRFSTSLRDHHGIAPYGSAPGEDFPERGLPLLTTP